MRPGSHVAVFGRSEDALGLRSAGLQLRDTISVLLPGVRVLFAYLFRVPMEGTVAENVLRYGTGGLYIDGCRIAHVTVAGGNHADNPHLRNPIRVGAESEDNLLFPRKGGDCLTPTNSLGRWPTNLLLVHGPDCVRVGDKRLRTHWGQPHAGKGERIGVKQASGWGTKKLGGLVGYADPEGIETVPNWQCQSDCPVRLLDGQSGDAGGASRFFPQFEGLPEALTWLTRLIGAP